MGIVMHAKRKAFAYITQGQKLLVFEHQDSLEAGIQVPAGTIERRESPDAAALREAQEETGLQMLSLVAFLGEQTRDMSDFHRAEIHYRYFYHVRCDQETPQTWLYGERFPSDVDTRHDDSPEFRHVFRCYWVALDAVPPLIADHGYYLDKLRASLSKQPPTEQE